MFIITRISLTTTSIMAMTVLAKLLGILDSRYANMIIYGGVAIHTILLIIVIIVFIKTRRIHEVRIIRYQLHDKPVKGETNILPEDISTTNPRKYAIFKIFLKIDNVSEAPEIGIFKMAEEKFVPDIKKHIININTGMVDHSFMFDADVIVNPGEKINFQIKKDTIINTFFLGESYTP